MGTRSGAGARAPQSVSRRGFLKSMGLAAGTAALPPFVAGQEADGAGAIAGLRVLGAEAQAFALTVNGELRTVTAAPRATLLDVLRNQLGLTGAKEACDRGACGGCTVLLDGVAVNSCMTLAVDASGREVTTVEGLAAEEPVEGLCAHDGAQCGFCIPGFVVRGRALLGETPRPTPGEIRAGLAGNLCRCGTYTKIFDGLLAASGQAVAETANGSAALENEGARVEIREKVTGAAKYTADIRREGMLFGQFVRFPFGAGRVVEWDVEAARAVPGVVEVEMYEDAREARFVGHRIGHVIGETPDAVEDAIEALAVRVREDGSRTRASEHHEGPPALEGDAARQLDEALQGAAVIVEGTFTTEVQTHSCLEPHGAVVEMGSGRAEAWGSTQACQGFREGLQGPLGLEGPRITFHCEHVGGGFGSKFGPGPQGRLAAEAAVRLGRPVQVMNDRRGEHLDGGNRPGSIQHWRMGADAEGRIVGARLFAANIVGFEAGGGEVNLCDVYRLGPMVNDQVEISLSAGLPSPFRAPGFPQGSFALESMIDEIAKALGRDPLEIRRINATSERRVAQLDRGAGLIGWERRRPDGTWPGRVKTGFGCGQANWGVFGDGCQIEVQVLRSGRVEVYSGAQDIGTGCRTILVDVTADELGIPREGIGGNIGVSTYPPGPASGGSVTSRLVATTTRDAAIDAKRQLSALVAAEWGVEPERVRLGGGLFREDGGTRTAEWAAACSLISEDRLTGQARFDRAHTGEGDTSNTQFAEVEADTETGIIRVKRMVTIQAGGQAVNRLTFENQMCGGVIQGISFALFEERTLDGPTGGMLNANLEWYKIAGSMDIPEIIPIIDKTDADTGVRPIGEPTTIPTAAAVANAVANALGVRVWSLPMTPARVLAALEQGGRA